jgi:HEAT repeat protein
MGCFSVTEAIPALVEQLEGASHLDFTNWPADLRANALLMLHTEAALALAKLGDERGYIVLRELFDSPEPPMKDPRLIRAAGALAEFVKWTPMSRQKIG